MSRRNAHAVAAWNRKAGAHDRDTVKRFRVPDPPCHRCYGYGEVWVAIAGEYIPCPDCQEDDDE